MTKPKAVVFDLGNVLLDFDYRKAASGMAAHCDARDEEILAALNQSTLLHRFESGELSGEEFFNEVKAAAKFRQDLAAFKPLFCDIFSPVPKMIDLNERLRADGVPTYVFSNTNELQVGYIRTKFPFFANFAAHILSFEHRAMKPHPAIYAIVEKTAGFSGPDLLYIDDRAENVEGGEIRGWQTIHHTDIPTTIAKVESLFSLR